jgi:hypothetical protein
VERVPPKFNEQSFEKVGDSSVGAVGRITHFIWTDIPSDDEDAFNAWYNEEHMPDRVVRIPGFLRGRRFKAIAGGPRYLAYYEMANGEVFFSTPYVAMRSEPDPKSRYFVARFQNALRSTSSITCETDAGEGSYLGIVGLDTGDDKPPFAPADITKAKIPGVTRVRLSRTEAYLMDGNATRMAGHSRASLRPPDKVPNWVLTIEGKSQASVEATAELLRSPAGSNVQAKAIMQLIKEVNPP